MSVSDMFSMILLAIQSNKLSHHASMQLVYIYVRNVSNKNSVGSCDEKVGVMHCLFNKINECVGEGISLELEGTMV